MNAPAVVIIMLLLLMCTCQGCGIFQGWCVRVHAHDGLEPAAPVGDDPKPEANR